MFNVEYSYVIGCRNDGPVVRVGHKLDGENVGAVAGKNRGRQMELRSRRLWVVRVDVDTVVVRPRSQQATRSRPTGTKSVESCYIHTRRGPPQCINTSTVTLQLVHYVQVLNPVSVPIYSANASVSLRAQADLSPG